MKKLHRRGNSLSLVIDRSLMEQLGIGPDTPLQMTVSSGCLLVRPLTLGVGPDGVASSLKKIRSRPGHPEMLKKLAE